MSQVGEHRVQAQVRGSKNQQVGLRKHACKVPRQTSASWLTTGSLYKMQLNMVPEARVASRLVPFRAANKYIFSYLVKWVKAQGSQNLTYALSHGCQFRV
jgi:hypothetical protein